MQALMDYFFLPTRRDREEARDVDRLAELKRANDLKEREVEALERIAKAATNPDKTSNASALRVPND